MVDNLGHIAAQLAGDIRPRADRVHLLVARVLEKAHVAAGNAVYKVSVRSEGLAGRRLEHAAAAASTVEVEREEVAPRARDVTPSNRRYS